MRWIRAHDTCIFIVHHYTFRALATFIFPVLALATFFVILNYLCIYHVTWLDVITSLFNIAICLASKSCFLLLRKITCASTLHLRKCWATRDRSCICNRACFTSGLHDIEVVRNFRQHFFPWRIPYTRILSIFSYFLPPLAELDMLLEYCSDN